MARFEQQPLPFPNTWGGRRPGAGRPAGTRRSKSIPHTPRPTVSKHRPHHVTVRVARGTWNLRSQRCFAPVCAALSAVRKRAGFRVVQFSVQHDHVHMIVEADDRRAMSEGLRVLLIRVARGLNRTMNTRGHRFADRYHEHVLGTPTEVLNALRYVIGNRVHHLRKWGVAGRSHGDDAFSSAACTELVRPPRSWLLREGWTRAGP